MREDLAAPRLQRPTGPLAPDDVVPLAVWREALAPGVPCGPGVAKRWAESGAGRAAAAPGRAGLPSGGGVRPEPGEAMRVYLAHEAPPVLQRQPGPVTHGVDDEVRDRLAASPERGPMFVVSIGALVTFANRQVDDPTHRTDQLCSCDAASDLRQRYQSLLRPPVVFGGNTHASADPRGRMNPHAAPGTVCRVPWTARLMPCCAPCGGDQAVQRLCCRVLRRRCPLPTGADDEPVRAHALRHRVERSD